MPKKLKKSEQEKSKPEKIPNQVKQARESCGWTMKQLATKSEVSEKTISRIEDGDPKIKKLIKHRVASALEKHNAKYNFANLFPNG